MQSTTKSLPTRPDWNLAFWWVIATVIGWIVGFFACGIIKGFINSIRIEPVDGAIMGLCMGIAQAIVLDKNIGKKRWWIIATFIGFALGKGAGDLLTDTISGTFGVVIEGALIGFCVGLGQWILLQNRVPKVLWWIPFSILAWIVGWAIIGPVYENSAISVQRVYFIGGIGAGIAGVILGGVLAFLFGKPQISMRPISK